MVMEWAQSTDADFDRYELHRSLDTGFEPSPSTLVAQISDRAGVVYNVTGLAPNTTYFFKVRVYDTGQLSNDSNEMNGTTLGPNMPPAAPTLADPEQITETTVFLEWTANTEADFAQYAVHRSTAKAFAPTTATFVANVTGIRATSYNVTQLKPGTTYYFKIEVQDQAGKSNLSNEVSARTLTVNIPPTCDAGGDRTVTVNSIVEFRATASDPDGQIVSYQWDFNSDGDWDTNSTTGTATYVYSQVGSYSARLRVQDDRDAFAESVANMTVIPAVPPNLLPLIHDVGEDGISAYIGDEVFFAANASDPDGFITKYQWDFKGDGLYEYGSDTDANTTYTYDTAGNFTAVLRVTDNRDGVSFGYRNVSVTRLDHAPIPKIDAPREDQKFYVDDLITLNGQSSEDPDGDPMTFLWENDRTNTKLGTSALVKLTMDKGNYTIRLTVSDGELSTIALVNISVADRPNVIPTIKIESPLNNAVVKGLLTLTGSARDNTKVVRVEVRVDPTGSWKTATGTKSWSFEIDTKPLAAGQHTVYARAYDGTDYSTEASIKLTFQNEVAKTPETKGFIPGFETGALALTLLLAGAWLNMARKGKGTD